MPMQGTEQGLERREGRGLAGALGWLGIVLGVAGLVAPRRTARMIGVRDTPAAVATVRVVGLRELACGLGILTRPHPAGWLWARATGDLMDLALLSRALTTRRARRSRVALTTAAVVGVTALDVRCARELSRPPGTSPRHAVTVRRTITIGRSPQELYQFWRDLTNLPRFMQRLESVQPVGDGRTRWRARGPAGTTVEWEAEIVEDRPDALIGWRSRPGSPLEHAGTVRLERAPGGRGTQVRVELGYTPPGGGLAAAIARVLGRAPEQELQEDLRRLKQLMETGDIVRSEGVLRGVARPADGASPRPLRAVAMGGRR